MRSVILSYRTVIVEIDSKQWDNLGMTPTTIPTPRASERLDARVPPALVAEVRELAAAQDRSAGSVVRLALREFVDRHREAKPR